MGKNEPPVGYVLKQAQSLLRLRMEEALRPLDLTVSQYSCLHRLRLEPDISAAALARSTFVTRQSMNAMLQQLLDRGLVARPAQAESGRALPTRLTAAGNDILDTAEERVEDVNDRMVSGMTAADETALARGLAACVRALAAD